MPINSKQKLAKDILDLNKVEQAPTRKGYGEGLLAAGEADERVVALCADLTGSTMMDLFAKKFPDRFIEIGVAEQNLAAIASGLANYGKIPFISSYAMFSPGRNWEQIRTTICYNDVPVIIAGSHAGVSVGPDGATHQAIEDMAIMRVIPNMVVIAPCDMHEAKKATLAAAKLNKPVYIRFAREKTPIPTTPDSPFEIEKAEIFWNPSTSSGQAKKADVAIIACGPLVHNAILAANELEGEGMGVVVVNNHTIKPLDEKLILEVARNAGAIVTVEEHQIVGGLGSAVAEFLAKNFPVPMEFVGVSDRFGESGEPNQLIEVFGMGKDSIKKAVKRAVERKLK